ncbi:MAG: tRNA (guanosine(37)-N1)-methyltransferase TrmD [Candidatus Marinimicrobia bacterium]|nr:tRNA (guanosine(37)-N1)-methyltransferase TrmD [Candidatus Neomarinimicrobiota bacterium]MBT3946666.1 tRNA (guanosine(37)-N1)-methyltransferase TrmD [Candidatus Neomarinimicrobiota bacterium]MBT4065583.1 tRNA (guanosine(37)-N1)-methyltransferase TrmD [Candidatus Neomarinimicrobiota bacterium]MBT4308630.1 tRNA (guanosine(37)-N1)-methyltransferase TrmD [Candidatus Neomarinimicrobiota bacterium]MBT4453738.1 tRNA (guanosine(37)-N1)-methyltransferase TrmD [Candidatus Neomarinimicrobiota bacterium
MKHQIAIITPAPDLVEAVVQHSMLRQAVARERVDFHLVNLRDFGEGNYRQTDDTPFGGGAGMVMMAGPLFKAIEVAIENVGGTDGLRIVYPSPQGQTWSHELAIENSSVKKLIVICGHYKGIDERVIEKYVSHEYSIGDFVVTSGEIPGMILIDSIVRLIPGVLNKIDSAMSDTFSGDLLDAPHYTQPREIDGMAVPDVLISGHHKKIEEWRKARQEERTKERRPDIWKHYLKLNESEKSDE